MTTTLRGLCAALAVAAGLALLARSGTAGGQKADAWKPVLTPEVAKDLLQRESKRLQELLTGSPDEQKLEQARFSALLIAGIARSTKGGDVGADGAGGAALKIAGLLKDKANVEAARKLAQDLSKGGGGAAGKAGADVKEYMDVAEFMNFYRLKAKGGEGLHPSLHVTARFKTALNGVEELVRHLGSKKLNDAALSKASDELAVLAQRIAVSAGWTHGFAPDQKKGKRDPAVWHELSDQMRDAAVSLADAAKKKDVAAVHAAGKRLDASCTQCHSLFR